MMPHCELRALIFAIFAAVASGLEARWTPASDGGPARFSKRHRDAQGIDDSRWIDGDESSSWGPKIFPETTEGWLFALACGVGMLLVYNSQQQQQQPAGPSGYRTGGEPTARPGEAGPAGEAARAAFLKKYGGGQDSHT